MCSKAACKAEAGASDSSSEAATGEPLGERYDRGLADIFSVQDEITTKVSEAIQPALGRSERNVPRASLPTARRLEAITAECGILRMSKRRKTRAGALSRAIEPIRDLLS
jgi:hypothetical protein